MTFNEKLQEAFALFEAGELRAAKNIYNRLFISDLTVEEKIQVRFNYGYLLLEQQQMQDALHNYEAALHLAQHLGDKERISQAYHQIGMVYRLAENYEKALDHFKIERNYIERNFPNNQLFIAANAYETGYTNLLAENIKNAAPHLNAALTHSLKTNDPVMTACAYRGLGDLYRAQKNYEAAENAYKQSVFHFTKAQDEMGVSEVMERLLALAEG